MTSLEFSNPFEEQMVTLLPPAFPVFPRPISSCLSFSKLQYCFQDPLSMFPSAPGVTMSAPSSASQCSEDGDHVEQFGVYDHQRPAPSKLPTVAERRQQRVASLTPIPPALDLAKRHVPPPVSGPTAFQPSLALHPLLLAQAPVQSRVKSTTPNIALLFSLFDVLEADDDLASSSSSFSSSSLSPPASPHSTVSSDWTPESNVSSPVHRGFPRVYPAPMGSNDTAWDSHDRISILSNLADVLN